MPHPTRPHQLSSSRPISTQLSPNSPPSTSTPRPPSHLPIPAHSIDLQNLSDDIQFRKVLATSEHEYRVQQAILASREAQELEAVRIQSESQARLDRARLASWQQAELEALQLVIQRSQQPSPPPSSSSSSSSSSSRPRLLLPSPTPTPPPLSLPIPLPSSYPPPDSLLSPQNEEQERIALELAIALSLNQVDPSSSLSSPISSPRPSTSLSSISSPPALPLPPSTSSSSSSSSPSHTLAQAHPQIGPSLPNPHRSPVDLPPPYERALEDLPSEPTTPLPLTQPLPISTSSSINSSNSQSYHLSCQPSNPLKTLTNPSHRPRSVFGRPLPPIPVSPDLNLRRHSSIGSQQPATRPYPPRASSSTPPVLNSIIPSCSPELNHHPPASLFSHSINHPTQDRFSDRFATRGPHPISPQLAPSIELSHPSNGITSSAINNNPAAIIIARDDQADRERVTSQEVSQSHRGPSSSSFSSPDSGYSSSSPLSPSGSSFLSPSDSVPRTSSLSASDSFVANPTPHEGILESIKYGKIQSLYGLPTTRGQFPDILILSQYSSESPQDKVQHPLMAIEAWSWELLLRYLMWHGKSRIEAGPLDVTQAEDDGLGPWQVGISFVFEEQEGETSVRLVLELIAGNGDSQWSRNESSKEKRRASLIGSTRSSNECRGHTVIHLPKPFTTLPIQLSTLATYLNTAADMTGSSSSTSSSLASTFKSSKSHRMSMSPTIHNSEVYARLSKAIKANAKALGQKGTTNHEEEKLLKRSKKLLKRKKDEIVGSLSGSSSHSSSHISLGNRIYHAHHRHRRDDVTGVDGLGLPLPQGATLVQPWESDWA